MLEDRSKIKLGKYIPEEHLIWLDGFTDNIAGIKAFNQCVVLADVMEDKEPRFICADISCKLKVFKNESLNSETKLQFTPVGLVSFYGSNPSNVKSNLPYLAVAGGAYIFVYKHLKGTFKFLIPNVDPNPDEVQIWTNLKEGKMEVKDAVSKLLELKTNLIDLSTRSQELLALPSGSDLTAKQTFIDERKHIPITITNYISCMCLLRKDGLETETSLSNIVIGTECGFVYIIDQSGSKIILKIKIPSVPHLIATSGCYDIEYQIYLATRDNIIYTIRNSELTSLQIEIAAKIFGIVKTPKGLIVGCADATVHSYNQIGQKNFAFGLPADLTCLEALEIKTYPLFAGYMLGLKNGEFRVYNERVLNFVFKFAESVHCVKFGNYSNYGKTFIFITESGGLIAKKLKNIDLDKHIPFYFPTQADEIPLSIPKKTKLYLDLIEREKEMASTMHNIFQNDLLKLRYKTFDTYSKMLKLGNAPQNYNTTSKVKMSASLQGLGPNFKIVISVDNVGEEIIAGVDMLLDYEKNIFSFDRDYIELGLLVPNVPITYTIKFRNVSENGNAGTVKVLVNEKSHTTPLISTLIKVPISELDIF